MKLTNVDIRKFEAPELVTTTYLPTIVYSGTTTFIFEEQKEDVFSRDVIIEKEGFKTKTDKKYNPHYPYRPSEPLSSRYSENTVNPNFYKSICITGKTSYYTID